MRALLSLLVLVATSAFADVSQARKDEVAKAPVVIVRGSADAMESVLGRAKASFVIVDAAELAELPLHSKQVVMVNCTGVMSQASLDRLKRFVTAGGFLYTTDHAVANVVQKLFPNTIAWTGGSTQQEVVPVRIHGTDEDRGLLNSLGGNAKELWQTAGGGYPVKVLDPKRVTVLMDSPVAEKKYGSGIVAVRFRWEDGQVIHVTGHFATQPGQTREQVAESGGRVFEQLSNNVVQAKAADEGRIDSLYGASTKRSLTLQAAPMKAAPPAATAPAPMKAGEKLKVLEKKQDYTRVRDQQGNEGWVPSDAL
ncbi:MAG: hypothetical protein Q8L48_37595 [Archangium sp.]|nr:hypothetical protein [Archangium sp.]